MAALADGYGPRGGGGHGPGGYSGGGGSGYGGHGYGGGTGDNGFGGRGGESAFLGFDISAAMRYRTIHGILCAVAMVALFPIGSILMRIVPGRFALWVHGIFQLLALCVYVAGAGLGIYLVTIVRIPTGNANRNGGGTGTGNANRNGGGTGTGTSNLLDNEATRYHPIIGLVVLAILVLQPALGLIHHSRFKRVRRRQVWSYLHLFNGRVGITLGIINGGLGLSLSGAPARWRRVYIAVAAVMWSLWMLVALWAEVRRLRQNRNAAKAPVTAAAATTTPAVPPLFMTSAKNIPDHVRRSDSRGVSEMSRSISGRSRSRSRSY